MTRRRFSAKALTERLLACGGKCAGCGCKVGGAAGLEWDHELALAMGGADDLDNLRPLCRPCHRAKTRTDHGHIAKAKRMNQRAAGIGKQARNPLPGSRGSKWKRRMDGKVVPR